MENPSIHKWKLIVKVGSEMHKLCYCHVNRKLLHRSSPLIAEFFLHQYSTAPTMRNVMWAQKIHEQGHLYESKSPIHSSNLSTDNWYGLSIYTKVFNKKGIQQEGFELKVLKLSQDWCKQVNRNNWYINNWLQLKVIIQTSAVVIPTTSNRNFWSQPEIDNGCQAMPLSL